MLSGVADPRKPRGVRHRIGAVLAVMVLAALAGGRNFRELADRAAELPPDLLSLAGCRVHPATGVHVTPSKATMRRIAHGIDADAADERVCEWLRAEAIADHAPGDGAPGDGVAGAGLVAVAMDGKTLRNTIEPGGVEGSEIKLFSALTHADAVVIAQVRVPADTNEITQVAALLDGVDLTGVVVSGDAAHAQHATAAYLAGQRGGHYALSVKGNQPSLRAQLAAAVPPAVPGTEHHVSVDRSHGRIVRRAIWVAPARGVGFPGAAQAFLIRRDTFDHAGHWLSKEIVHGVTSLTAAHATPAQLAWLIRAHWTVENKSHWVRDVVYREDHQHAYAGTDAQVMATVRNLALGLLRLAGITEITRTVQWVAADRRRIFPIIAAATSTNRL
ncbi:MAG TPA: ISAs1 family transposase [Pseudonocardiaceae bacterium]|nr:ISAs1 family transposase [Pseudonocardiaceae bacterium]